MSTRHTFDSSICSSTETVAGNAKRRFWPAFVSSQTIQMASITCLAIALLAGAAAVVFGLLGMLGISQVNARSYRRRAFAGALLGVLAVLPVALLPAARAVRQAKQKQMSRAMDLGDKYRKEANPDAAVEQYNEAIRLDPTCVLFHANRAEVHKQIGAGEKTRADSSEVEETAANPELQEPVVGQVMHTEMRIRFNSDRSPSTTD